MTKKRKIHMDILRVFAIILVIYNHTNEKGYYLFSITENPVTYPFYMALSILCSVAVPLFFMISGALLLGKEETLKILFKKRVVRIILVILIFSFMQYVYKSVWADWEFSLGDFFKRVISSPVIVPYWYLYAYLAYVIMLPFLRSIVKTMKAKNYIYLFMLYIVVSGLGPIFQFFLGIDNINLTVPMLESTIFFPLAGYYFENHLPEKYYCKRTIVLGTVLSIVSVIVLCLLTWYRGLLTGEMSEWGSGLFITGLTVIPTFTIYVTVKWVCGLIKFNVKAEKVLALLSSLTFGIYLLEERFREGLVNIDITLAPIIGWMPACFVWILSVFVCSGAVAFLLKKIPGIKKIL